jgi:hypothetical protein
MFLTKIIIPVPAGAHREVPELRGPEELPLAQRGGVRQDSRVRWIQKRKKHSFMLLFTGTVQGVFGSWVKKKAEWEVNRNRFKIN